MKCTALERFMRHVSPRQPNGCVLWLGAKNQVGYGNFMLSKGRMIVAHRAAWILQVGDLPRGRGASGVVLRHTCDNPSCVSIEHLCLGTQLDNMRDMVVRGRANGPKGERNRWAAFTDDEAGKIRELRKSGVSAKTIADRYGVSRQCIFRIISGRSYTLTRAKEELVIVEGMP